MTANEKSIFRIFGIALIVLSCALVLAGCGDEAPEPVFLTVNPPNIEITEDQGTEFQQINEYFIFHRTSLLGGFSYGHEVPVLAEGMEDILIFPGIRKNGLTSQPDIYFIMTEDTLTRNFVPGERIEFTPTYRYRDNVNYKMMDDFENGTFFTEDIDGNISTTLVRETNEGYENSVGGVMRVSADNPLLEVVSEPGRTTFAPAGDIILEVTYKNNTEFGIGVYGTTLNVGSERFYKVILFPSEEWNKVYVDLSDEIRNTGYDSYQILLGVNHKANVANGEVMIDDIKWLYLE